MEEPIPSHEKLLLNHPSLASSHCYITHWSTSLQPSLGLFPAPLFQWLFSKADPHDKDNNKNIKGTLLPLRTYKVPSIRIPGFRCKDCRRSRYCKSAGGRHSRHHLWILPTIEGEGGTNSLVSWHGGDASSGLAVFLQVFWDEPIKSATVVSFPVQKAVWWFPCQKSLFGSTPWFQASFWN